MTLRSAADVGYFLVAGRSIMPRVANFEDNEPELLEDSTPIGVAYDEWSPVGQSQFELTVEGFYDDAAGAIVEALTLKPAAPLMYAPEGNTIGLDFIGVNAARTSFQRLSTRGALSRANATYKTDTGRESGVVSADLVARTSVGPTDTTTVDNLASSANGAAGYLGVTALDLDGGTGVDIALRDSTDDIGYADLIAFTEVTSLSDALRAQRAAVAGTVNQYTQTRHTFNGGAGASRTITFATGLVRL